jgi:hypothetical protein
MLAITLAFFTMLAVTKVALDVLYAHPGNQETATLIMILGSLLAMYLALGGTGWINLFYR